MLSIRIPRVVYAALPKVSLDGYLLLMKLSTDFPSYPHFYPLIPIYYPLYTTHAHGQTTYSVDNYKNKTPAIIRVFYEHPVRILALFTVGY